MAKQFITPTYVFNPAQKKITINISNFDIKLLANITNLTAGNTHIYVAGAKTGLGYASLNGNEITLQYDTTSMNAGDQLLIQYDNRGISTLEKADGTTTQMKATDSGAMAVGNALVKIRDTFEAGIDLTKYQEEKINYGDTIIRAGGTNSGASYVSFSPCPFTAGSSYSILTRQAFEMPHTFAFGISASQRFIGTNFEIGVVSVNSNGVEKKRLDTSKVAPVQIVGNITVASNVATIDFASHPFKGGERVILYGNADTRLNISPVSISVVSNTRITVPLTIANGTYTAGGFVKYEDYISNAEDGVSITLDSTSATSGTLASVRGGKMPATASLVIPTTVATSVGTPYSDGFIRAGSIEFESKIDDVKVKTQAGVNTTVLKSVVSLTTLVPSEDELYKAKITARNFENITRPIAKIVSIAKTGTTTATITTNTPHNLTTNSFVFITGVRDVVNFPTLTTATQVLSTPTSTTFTAVIGTASTSSSNDGMVVLANGSLTANIGTTLSVQSISRTNNILTITMNTTATGAIPGELWQLHGCGLNVNGETFDKAYIVRVMTGSTYIVEPYDGTTGADFTATNCGGAFFRRTEYRVDTINLIQSTRHRVEFSTPVGVTDQSSSIAVNVSNAVTLSGTSNVAVSSITAGTTIITNPQTPTQATDITSSAITTTTTTTAITPTIGSSYQFLLQTTAVSGTNPTLDVRIEHSLDGGTTWHPLYDFERITGVATLRTPVFIAKGNRIRYVQTVAGTTPSFTRSLTRISAPASQGQDVFQAFDRALTVNTINSTTASFYVAGYNNIIFGAIFTASGTPNASLQLEGSHDAINWLSIGTAITSSTTTYTQITNLLNGFSYARVRVASAGTGATLGYIVVKAY